MDSLLALLAEADALDKRTKPAPYWDCDVEYRRLLPALAAALRPFAAPVGVEAFEGLRRGHDGPCDLAGPNVPCTCGADAHNALLDQCIAAHVATKAQLAAALASDAESIAMYHRARDRADSLRSAILDGPDPMGCERCGLVTCSRPAAKAAWESTPGYEDEAPRYANTDAGKAYWIALQDCRQRPAVDWRDEMRGLWERAR